MFIPHSSIQASHMLSLEPWCGCGAVGSSLCVLSMWICSIKRVSLSHIASYSVRLDISSTVMSLGPFASQLTLAYVSGKNYHVMQAGETSYVLHGKGVCAHLQAH